MDKVLVNDIQGYSLHDGPGIRTTVFLKGCNLRCEWCQNPEGISPVRQVGFIASLCQGCGKCLKTCQNGAISADPSKHRVDYSKCIACGDCVESCYYNALVMYGKPMTVDELFEEASKDALFFDATGGGVTISGGEPMIHAEFVCELLKKLKASGINTAIETAGCVPWASYQMVLDYVDLFLFDLKIMDPKQHEQRIGRSNSLIHDNATALVCNGANVLFRMPLMSGINDDEDTIQAAAAFMKRIRNPRLQLMPYHRMGENKYKALDMVYPAANVPVMNDDEVNAVCNRYKELGIDCSVSR